MIVNWERRETVRNLRKRGLSYKEISKQIPTARSTLSNWCKDIELTKEQKDRLGRRYDTSLKGAKVVQSRRKEEVEKIVRKARDEIRSLTLEELKNLGIMLYWAEGNKTLFAGITNSDADMIRIMMFWFRNVCGVPENKFKTHLHIHSGQDEERMKKYWSSITGIPFNRFGKSYIKKEGSGYRKNVLYNGTIKINICDKNLLYKILGWIEGMKLQFSVDG